MKGCQAKDKTIRYRVVQCIAEMIAYLGEIEYVLCNLFPLALIFTCMLPREEAYTALRDILKERINDREPLVRVQAVSALSKLCGSEDPSDETTITDVLIETLNYDTSVYVTPSSASSSY